VPRWFLLTVATLPVIIGGCVVDSEGEEGAGAASASAKRHRFLQVKGAGLEHPVRSPRGRGFPGLGQQVVDQL